MAISRAASGPRGGISGVLPTPSTGEAGLPVDSPEANSETPEAALTRLLADMQDVPPIMVQTLLRCVEGPELDLKGLDEAQEHCIEALPLEAWAAVQRHAEANGGAITSVVIGKRFSITRLVDGLRQLPTLRSVTASAKQLDPVIDLRGLQGGGMQLQRVFIKGDPETQLEVIVPHGVSVEVIDAEKTVFGKSVVLYADAGGFVDPQQKPRPLQGTRHDRTAWDYMSPNERAAKAVQPDAQQHARSIKLNGRARTVLVDGPSGRHLECHFVCAQLAAWFLDARMAHHTGRAPETHFSFAPVRTARAIEQLDYSGLASEVSRMRAQAPSEIFSATTPAQTLQAAFEGLQPGSFRYFAVCTLVPHHMFGLELSAKLVRHGSQMRPEFAISLYDPNKTTKTERLVVDDPSKLSDDALEDWLESDSFASLYPWPPPQNLEGIAALPTTIRVPDESRLSPEFLHLALSAGGPALVRETVQSFVERVRNAGPEVTGGALEQDLLAEWAPAEPRPELEPESGSESESEPQAQSDPESEQWPLGLHTAVRGQFPQPAAVSAFVEEILAIAPEYLDPAAKCRVLAAADVNGLPLLNHAMTIADRWLSTDTHSMATTAMMEAILRAPDDALTAEGKLDLLLSRTNFGVPMLHEQCSRTPEPPLKRLQFEHKQIHDYILAIANSNLHDADKQTLFAAMHASDDDADDDSEGARQTTAAKAALDAGNLGAAAAMLLGVLHSNADADRINTWLAALGVTAPEVIAKFRSATLHPDDRAWARTKVAEIQAA